MPTAPGGGNDIMCRTIGQKLGERLKIPVVIENKAGGNATIAAEYVAKSVPDGYTLMFGYIASHGINPALSKLNYDPVRDFTAIGMVAEAQTVLVVHPSVAAKNVRELIALAKAELSWASSPVPRPASVRRRISQAKCSSKWPASTWCIRPTRDRTRRCSTPWQAIPS